MKYVGYVYRIHCLITNKDYIGITTKTFQKRLNQHKNSSKDPNVPKNKFYNAVLKYGWDNFEGTIITTVQSDTKEELKNSLDNLELYYIQKYDSYKNGYNSTLGGDGVLGYGQKEVKVYNEFGEYIETLPSRVEASEKYNVLDTSINDSCKRKILSCGKLNGIRLVFRDINDEVTQEDIEKLKHSRIKGEVPVKCYDYYTGELLNTFNSIKEASKYYNISEDSISKSAKKIRKCSRKGKQKLIWRHLNDFYTPEYKYAAYFQDGKLFKKYVEQVQAEKELNIDQTTISDCIRGKIKTAGSVDGKRLIWKKL